MTFSYLNLGLYLLILFISVSTDNIDTEFPITFTYRKSSRVAKLNIEQNIGSYFGLSVGVNQENGINYITIGSPRFESQLYDRVERSGAVFHCQWKEKDSNSEVICSEIDVRRASSLYVGRSTESTNKMLLGVSLTSNQTNFVGCAHGWAYDVHNVNPPPTPVGKCYIFNNRGHALNSFEPIALNRRRTFSRTTQTNRHSIGSGRPLQSHLMTGFSSASIDSGKSLVLGSPGYLDFMGAIIRESYDGEDILELDKLLNSNDRRLPTLNSYLGYAVTAGILAEQQEFIVMGAPRNSHFNGKVYLFPSNELFQRNRVNEHLFSIDGNSDAKGEYFGASLLALDINNDKLDDLIVGAPFYSNAQNREIGRIYVYMSDKGFNEFNQLIYGHKTVSRFGTALSSIDINLDGYQDAIISAPYERNSDGSSGALYIYLGSARGLNANPHKRIGAENIRSAALKGFGISIVSNTDFDNNGYNDILVGSYLSENAVLIRTKPIALLKALISFEPSKIVLHEKNCNNNQNTCFNVQYCVAYEGEHIRDKQSALITLDITDSKLIVKENRAKINNIKSSEQKVIQMRANRKNCFTGENSFVLMVNRRESLIDIRTPIEMKLSVALSNDSSNTFCKDCAFAQSYSTIANIDFEHGCQTKQCVSHLTLTAVSKYNGQVVVNNLIEGLHNTIDVDINVVNSGEASLNTVLTIKMQPFLLNLTDNAEANRCKSDTNSSSYRCEVSQILQKGEKENLNLHFVVSRIPTNNILIDFLINTSSSLQTGSKLRQSMKFDIIRKANIRILGESSKNLSFSDKTPKVLFSVSYNLIKSGPSTISSAFLEILLPVDVIELENESEQTCRMITTGYAEDYFPIINGTLSLVCDKESQYCTKYLCELPEFISGSQTQRLTLSLALIPSKIDNKDYNGIDLKLESQLKIEDKVKFESKISSSESVIISFARKVPIIDEKIEPWILFLSAGVGVFVLIITIIILIRYGFFRRKKREELLRVKQRMSMKPDLYDVKDMDSDASDSDKTTNN